MPYKQVCGNAPTSQKFVGLGVFHIFLGDTVMNFCASAGQERMSLNGILHLVRHRQDHNRGLKHGGSELAAQNREWLILSQGGSIDGK